MLGLLLDGDEKLLARVDVTTVDAYAHGIVRAKSAAAPKPIGDREQRQLWEKVVKQLGLPFTARFLAQEYRHVVLGQDLRDLDAYLGASRRGRGTGLGPARRRETWSGVERFEQFLRDRGETTHLRICARAAEILVGGPAPYTHVVVDEAQDLPRAQGYSTRQKETEALVERVRGLLAEGLAPHEIGVCARFNLSLDTAEEKLKAAGIPVLRVKGQVTQGSEGVRLATMHAMKGLEFRAVSVIGVCEGTVPFAREITPREADPLQHDADMLGERCLLFVACTRAREALSVTWSGAASPFLPDTA